MKIDSDASLFFSNRRTQNAPSSEQVEGAMSFAAIMAGQTRQAAGPAASSSATRSETYDFTNMTPEALHETVGILIRSGRMDLDESSSLLGMMPPSPLSKVNYDGTAPAYSNAPENFLARLQSAIDTALSRNEQSSAAGLQKAADALSRLQGQRVDLQA